MDTSINLSERLTTVEVATLNVHRQWKIISTAHCILKLTTRNQLEQVVKSREARSSLTGMLQIPGLQQPVDLEEEENHIRDVIEAMLARLEAGLQDEIDEIEAHRLATIQVFGDAGKEALEEAEKQIIAEEEIAAQGHV